MLHQTVMLSKYFISLFWKLNGSVGHLLFAWIISSKERAFSSHPVKWDWLASTAGGGDPRAVF